MSSLRIFEPRLFDPILADPFDSMFRRFMAPLRTELEGSALDMRIDVSEVDGHCRAEVSLIDEVVAQDVDETKATAKLDDGVLTLDLPKKASTAAKRLAIQ